MTNKEKFLALVSGREPETMKDVKARIRNQEMIEESQLIALKILSRLDDLGWSQKDLAVKMNVSPQQINKIVKGQENLTLATQLKLQEILNIPILATYYENALSKLGELISKAFTKEIKVENHFFSPQEYAMKTNYVSQKMKYDMCSNMQYYIPLSA